LKWLNISSNDIGDEGLRAISKCLKNIEKLSVGSFADEGITMDGIKAVYDAVSKLEKKVTKTFFVIQEYKVLLQRMTVF